MRRFISMLFILAIVGAGCSSEPAETGSGAQADPTAAPTVEATVDPTPLAIPTSAADPTPTPTVGPSSTATPTPAPTEPTVAPTSTAVPAPTATSAPISTATPVVVNPTPQPTAMTVPPTPTPTAVWVNPDCHVGAGAADEPVWWCGGKICVVGAPHYGCPIGPPQQPAVRISCTISDTDVEVNEIITLRAIQNPLNVPVQFAFSHGDGTIDNTSQSRAYYRQPGSYAVKLLWQYSGAKGTTPCGTVTVRPVGAATPTPTPTPSTLQIGCSISPQRTVKVNETLTFTAFQSPTSLPVSFVFDHGDGTLDPRSVSKAYYAAPGFYEVRLRWASGGQNGTTLCGTVTVEPNFVAADYLGRTQASAQALAISKGLTSRTLRIDDQYFAGTDDYRLDRVNFEIDNNVVTKAYLG